MSPPTIKKRRISVHVYDRKYTFLNYFSLSMQTRIRLTVLCVAFISITVQSAVVHKIGLIKNHVRNQDASVTLDHRPHEASWVTPRTNERWRKTNVRFLTKINWDDANALDSESIIQNTLADNDFHIIELETEDSSKEKSGSQQKLRIHLMRKSSVVHPNVQVVVRNGDEYETMDYRTDNRSKQNCHYVGQVTKYFSVDNQTLKDAADPAKNVAGIALLSTCTPAIGFSGLIIMEDGKQWYIEPGHEAELASNKRIKREAKAAGFSDSLEHVVLSHSDLSGHMASRISDVLRVPLPQLEEAARLAAVDAEARRSLRHVSSLTQAAHSDWDDDVASLESIQGESSILTPFFYGGAILPFIGRGDHSSKASQAKKLAAKKSPTAAQTTLLTPLETTTVNSGSSSYSSASVENHSSALQKQSRIVEIAVFTDEELYDKMKSKFKADTTAQLKEYATAMVNMMDVMYQHASLGVDLRFRLVYVEVMKRRPNNLKTNGGRAKAYLSSFCDYAGEKNANSAQWDHALLLTGVDLHEEGVTTTAGLAWAGTMCFRYYSCSISEGLNFASAYITTHEIGHSLGMEHDGVGISETCDSTKFIMSPTTGPGKVTWSPCSSNNLQDFIKYGTSELRGKAKSFNMISRPICLEELVSTRNKKSFLEDSGNEPDSDLKLPGEKYDANFQCSLGMGSFFKPHFERHKPPFDNICWILYCGNGTHAISTHPALEGTPCDRKKYCRAGQCIKRPEAT